MERLLARSKVRALSWGLMAGLGALPGMGLVGGAVAHAEGPGGEPPVVIAPGAEAPPVAAETPAPAASASPEPAVLPAPAPATEPPADASVASEGAPPPVPSRPRLGLALGMGLSWDSTGFVDRARGRVPSFAATAEARDTTFGVALAMLATSASGRFPYKDSPVDRLGVGLRLTVRPFAARFSAVEAADFLVSLARELTVAAGPAFEHAAAGTTSVGRFGLEGALSEDFVVYRDDRGSELRVRLIARRFWGPSRTLGTLTVGDSAADVGLALAAVF